jgi:phospholipid/cholesterol/gamma-HCH transport system substrate-binding protein
METRASHVAVGAFVLLLLAGAVAFIIWIGKFQTQEKFARYDILFDSSVTGLEVDGTVRYRGIGVGRVYDIKIDPDNIELIRVTIEISTTTPVRSDTVASLELQGITGVVYVLLSGGSNDAEPLPQTLEPPYPVLKSKPSNFEKIFEGIPELLTDMNNLVDRVTLLFNDENEQAIANILKNVDSLTGSFADDTGGIKDLLSNASNAAKQIELLAQDIRGQLSTRGGENGPTLADLIDHGVTSIDKIGSMSTEFEQLAKNLRGNIDTLVSNAGGTMEDLRVAAQQVANTGQAISAAAVQIDALVAENRAPLNEFSNNGLYELTQAVTEIRILVSSLTRIASQIERDPARFLFGDRRQGFEAQ